MPRARVRWNSIAGTLLMQEAELMRKLEMSQLKKQIEVFATFIPDEILDMPFSQLIEVQNYVGVLLFADVSGFTPLCEKYNKTGKGGIYRLTATLNAYIGAIVEVIYFYGGDVLKFSGDAFLAMWKVDPSICMYKVIHEVIVCALFIQQTLGRFETEVNVLLKVKLAIACGNMTFSVIGDEVKHYVIAGQAINDVKAAEHASVSGDVVIAPTAWGHVAEEAYDVTYGAEGNVKVWRCLYKPKEKGRKEEYDQKHVKVQKLCEKHIKHRSRLHAKKKFDSTTTDSKLTDEFIRSLPERKSMKNAPQRWAVDDMRPFIIKPVQEQVNENQPLEYLTEMREVTIQFINIVPTTFYEPKLVLMVDSAYQIVCKIVGKLLGVVNKVSLFDKDAMILVLFGLRGIKHELESQNALKSAYKIRQAISKLQGVKSVSVGVTNGLVYCGVVGHPLRREYTVIGGSVNKAARIMCAYTYKVTCDYKTYMNSKLASCYFQLQSALKLKGIEDAGHIFEYNEDFEENIRYEKQSTPLLGRDKELDLVRDLICHPERCEKYTGVCFYGKSKMGKSRLLATAINNCIEEGHTVASVYLCGGAQRPYYCISMLYRQLYDNKARVGSHQTTDIKDLPRNAWSINDVMQYSSSMRRLKVRDVFGSIASTGKDGFSVIFIDNTQFIDMQSLEIIIESLNGGCVRLIGAGQFEDESSWDTRYRMYQSDRIKFIELEPLSRKYVAPLLCQLLNVKGAHKKLINLIMKSCDGRPGWVQTSVLRQVNMGGIEITYVLSSDEEVCKHYMFPSLELINVKYEELDNDSPMRPDMPVARLCDGVSLKNEELTLAAISMDLFDSFTPYQQLVIKTAAVLGEIFSRSLLIVMLKYPNEHTFSAAIAHLFEEEAFDCATKYISTGGFLSTSNKLSCYCYMSEDEHRALKRRHGINKYAMCKLLHFKNKSLRAVAYDLLPANQRKELHLRITEVMENQNNCCPSCLRNNSAAIIRLRVFKDIMQHCNDPSKPYEVEERADSETECDPEIIKDVIRTAIRRRETTGQKKLDESKKDLVIPKRKVWDPSICFCLEILMKVYADLIYHSEKAGHLGKRIFFLMQYGVILVTMDECEEAIEYLSEASELCMLDAKQRESLITDAFRRLHVGKIHMLLASIYFRLGIIDVSKNHIAICLRQYHVPMTSMRYSLPNRILNRIWLTRSRNFHITNMRPKHSMFKFDFGICMNLISNILAAEGNWHLAKLAASRSLDLLRDSNRNVDIFCDVYSSALELYNICGDTHVCEKLERCVVREVLRKYTGNVIIELHALCKLIFAIFQTRILNGNILASIRIGYRTLDLTRTIHATYMQLDLLPILASILLLRQRIQDAVGVIRIVRNIGRLEDPQGLVGYYAFCVELNVETSFLLERVEDCDQFARQYFAKITNRDTYTRLESKLMVYLQCYFSRHGRWNEALRWKEKYRQEKTEKVSYIDVCNYFKYTECALLLLVKNLQQKKQFIELEQKKIESFLKRCTEAADRWKAFEPRTLHLKAYYCKLRGRTYQTRKLLRNAVKLARECNNILEASWISLNESAWSGGFSFGNEVRCIDWNLAKTYNEMQWSQIMYALPHHIN